MAPTVPLIEGESYLVVKVSELVPSVWLGIWAGFEEPIIKVGCVFEVEKATEFGIIARFPKHNLIQYIGEDYLKNLSLVKLSPKNEKLIKTLY